MKPRLTPAIATASIRGSTDRRERGEEGRALGRDARWGVDPMAARTPYPAPVESGIDRPERQPSLTRLAKRFKTDKWGRTHKYTPHYDLHFTPWRRREINLLEIGIGGYAREGEGGGSLQMWKAYFPHAQIFGLDI